MTTLGSVASRRGAMMRVSDILGLGAFLSIPVQKSKQAAVVERVCCYSSQPHRAGSGPGLATVCGARSSRLHFGCVGALRDATEGQPCHQTTHQRRMCEQMAGGLRSLNRVLQWRWHDEPLTRSRN